MQQCVLVIEPSEHVHELVRMGLSGEPIELHFATDAECGRATAAAIVPDLILLAVDLPGSDGFELCRAFKSDPALTSLPIIFLTGATSTEKRIRGLDLGAVDYITKPIDAAELRARVGAGLRTKYLCDLLAQRAMIDGLTGLWNRSYLEHRLGSELSLARRTGDNAACLLVDLDHFDQINEQHGHSAGDAALRAVSRTLMSSCRLEDVVCRFAGEEFAVLAPNTTGPDALTLAERLRQRIAESQIDFRGKSLQVTCSIGIADTRTCGEEDLLAAAEAAVKSAKRTGRDRIEYAKQSVAAAG